MNGGILRYVGSKNRAARDIFALAPSAWSRMIDPFCGSNALLWALPSDKTAWVNDVDPDVFRFWSALGDDDGFIDALVAQSEQLHNDANALRIAFAVARYEWKQTGCPKAYFLLNHYAYGQFVARERRNVASFAWGKTGRGFTKVIRPKLEEGRDRLRAARLTNLDYLRVLDECDGQAGAWVFFDPPYWCGSRLYSHDFTIRDHEQMADRLRSLKSPFVMTINECELTHRLYMRGGFNVIHRGYQYCAVGGPRDAVEIVVRNY